MTDDKTNKPKYDTIKINFKPDAGRAMRVMAAMEGLTVSAYLEKLFLEQGLAGVDPAVYLEKVEKLKGKKE